MYQYLVFAILGLLWFPTVASAQDSPSLLNQLGLASTISPLLDSPEADPLPPDKAYNLSAFVEMPDRLRLRWVIATGTYLYKDHLHLTLENANGVELGPIVLPPGVLKQNAVRPDGDIGTVEVYHSGIDLAVPLQRSNPKPTQITLVAKYQGCAERGICYPPIIKKLILDLPAVVATKTALPTVTPTTTSLSSTSSAPLSEQDRLVAKLQHGSLWAVIATFYGLGLLLAFTPCIFPMIPILSGIIVGQGHNLTPQRGFMLSLIYVLAMALTYTAAGIITGLFGQNLQADFQNPWILSTFALLFVALALAMFGFYELQLPARLQTQISNLSNRQRGGGLLGVAIMGMLSALIVGPCVAPPLAGALIYIGHNGDAIIGGLALFFLSLGMGTPLLIIGASAGRFLPRAGAWMEAVKAIFGVLMLGIAIMLLERILPPFVVMLLWGSLLICTAVYMGALRRPPTGEPNGWVTLWQGLGMVMLVYGILMLVGAGAGGRDTLKPLQGLLLVDTDRTTEPSVAFQTIRTSIELDSALAEAAAHQHPLILDFYADWCTNCKELERYTFADTRVRSVLVNFVRLQIDVTANDANDQALLHRFNLTGPPAVLFYNRNGQEQHQFRVMGFMSAEQFSIQAKQILKL